MTLKEAQDWISEQHKAGATIITVTCNPMKRILYLYAGNARRVINCPTPRETRLLKDILREYVERITGSR